MSAEDSFNLYGIRDSVPHYKEGMSLVRDFAAGESCLGLCFLSANHRFSAVVATQIPTLSPTLGMASILKQQKTCMA